MTKCKVKNCESKSQDNNGGYCYGCLLLKGIETGSAEINIKLNNGQIVVSDSMNETLLTRNDVKAGTWQAIFDVLEDCKCE